MVTTTIQTVREKLQHNWLTDNIRRARHVGLGALVVLQEELADLVDRLGERGEAAEKDGLKFFNKLWGERTAQAKEAMGGLEKSIDVDVILNKMHLTTRRDMEVLNEQLEGLGKKLDKLVKPAAAPRAKKPTPATN